MASRAWGTRALGAIRSPAPARVHMGAVARLGETLRAHEHRTAAGLCALFALIYLWPVLIGGDVLSPAAVLYGVTPWKASIPSVGINYYNGLLSDVPLSYYPWDVFARTLLHSGTFPAWNPHAFAGTPFFANFSVGWLSPFNLPLWILPLDYALGLTAALKLWAAAFGMYLLVRELRLGFWPGLLAGASFALCAFDVVWLTHQAHVAAAALLPWTIWLTERIVRRGGRTEGIALACVVAAALAAGHPGTEVHVLSATLLYAVIRSATVRGAAGAERLRRLATVGSAVLVGVLLTAVVLLPATRAAAGTVGAQARQNGGSGTLIGSTLPFRSLLAAAFPDWWGRPSETLLTGPANYNERAFYAGTVALLLAFVGFASQGARRRKAAFVALAALGLAVPLRAPLIWTLVVHLPLFDRVQNQRMVLWFAFAVPVLGAFGLDALLHAPRHQRRAWATLGAAALAGVAAIAMTRRAPGDVGSGLHHLIDRFAGSTPGALELASVVRWLALVVVMAGALLVLRARPRRTAAIGGLVALLAALDMLTFAHAYQPMGPKQVVLPPSTPAIAFLQQHVADGRIAGVQSAVFNDWSTIYGLRDARGYDAPQPDRRFFALWRTINPEQLEWGPFDVPALTPRAVRLLGLLGTRYLVTEPSAAVPDGRLEYAYRGPDAAVLENALVAPHAFVARRVRIADGEQREIAAATETSFDPRRDAVVPLGEAGGDPPEGVSGGNVRIVREADASVTLRASLPRRGLVVLDDAWAPGWSVTIDGRPATALHADIVMRGVAVPAGMHTIAWRYRVPGLPLGAALSGLGLLALLGWAGVLVARARRSTR